MAIPTRHSYDSHPSVLPCPPPTHHSCDSHPSVLPRPPFILLGRRRIWRFPPVAPTVRLFFDNEVKAVQTSVSNLSIVIYEFGIYMPELLYFVCFLYPERILSWTRFGLIQTESSRCLRLGSCTFSYISFYFLWGACLGDGRSS